MADTIIGANSLLGIGTEAVEGQPVQVQGLLDYSSGTITRDLKVLYSKSLRRTAASRIKKAAGVASYAGDFTVDVTPEGISKMLSATFGAPVTSGNYGGYASTWTNSFQQLPHTIVQQLGSTIKVFAGCRGSSFKLTADKEQDSVIQAMFGIMAINEYIYSDPNIVGITGAGYDPLPPFSPVQGTLSIGGVVTALAKSFEVNCNKNLGTRNVLNGYRGPLAHFAQVSDVTGTMSLYFNDENALKQYFGQASSVVAPYGATSNVLSTPITLAIVQSGVYELDVVFPNCAYDKVGEPVQGQNEIMQEVALAPLYDPVTGTDMLIVLKNTQSGAVITTPGTLISSVPATGVQPYHNP